MNNKRGIIWFLSSLVCSALSDALMKWLMNEGASFGQVTMMRLLGGIVFLFFGCLANPGVFRTSHLGQHLLRGILFVGGMLLWSHGLGGDENSNTTGTVISFLTPVFVCLFSALWLGEKLPRHILFTVCALFIGMGFIFYPKARGGHLCHTLSLVVGAFFFAMLDVYNKKSVGQDAILTMVFYSNVVGFCLSALFLGHEGALPAFSLLPYFALLGLNGILTFGCILKAYQHSSLVSLVPLHFLELLVSIPISIFLFDHVPYEEVLGAFFIIPAVAYTTYQSYFKGEGKG